MTNSTDYTKRISDFELHTLAIIMIYVHLKEVCVNENF